MPDQLIFRSLKAPDWKQVAQIYKQGIETGNATFQSEIPSWDEWDKNHLKSCRLVAEINGQFSGWAALSPVSSRCVYSGVAEVSIYVGELFKGKRIGSQLMDRLIEESELNEIWTLQSSIFSENLASIRLHETHGFRFMGYREKVGKMNGIWRDTLMYERRSNKIGIS